MRCLFELSDWDSAMFVTLTYSDEYLHGVLGKDTLDKKELRYFFKRLRVNAERHYGSHEEIDENGNEKSVSNRPIKYYACGEYGEKLRSHYHAIIFGLDNYSEDDRKLVVDSWNNEKIPRCEPWLFDRERGRESAIQPCTPDDIAYVTGYVEKKLLGDKAKLEYMAKGRRAPFSICSQRLGLNHCMANAERLYHNAYTYTTTGKRIGLPSYFREKLGIDMQERLDGQEPTRPRVQQLQEEAKILFDKFRAYLERRGLRYSDSLLASSQYERLWNDFYDSYMWTRSNEIYQDFLDKQRKRGIKV